PANVPLIPCSLWVAVQDVDLAVGIADPRMALEVVEGAMKLVRAAFRDGVDLVTGGPAVFGSITEGDDLNSRDSFGANCRGRTVYARPHRHRAVNHIVFPAAAPDTRCWCGGTTGAGDDLARKSGRNKVDPRRERKQGHGVPVLDRQYCGLFRFDGVGLL